MHIEEIAQSFVLLEEGHPDAFAEMSRAVFAFQRRESDVYRRFCGDVYWDDWRSAPPLPVRAFKQRIVSTFPPEEAEAVFRSSATGSGERGVHHVRSLEVYHRSAEAQFDAVFGPGPHTILGHLPGYSDLGRESSLVHMVDHLIGRFGTPQSGLFLQDLTLLERGIQHARASSTRLILFGAAFGLLDLLDQGAFPLPAGSIVIETGGMKTRRRHVSRRKLHQQLAEGFSVPLPSVYSEYGMCELLSQCYTRGGVHFFPPPWLRFRILDPANPSCELPPGEPGVLAVFDLANLYTVSSLLTEDLAVQRGRGFEVLGRLTGAELRGCNFLLETALGRDPLAATSDLGRAREA